MKDRVTTETLCSDLVTDARKKGTTEVDPIGVLDLGRPSSVHQITETDRLGSDIAITTEIDEEIITEERVGVADIAVGTIEKCSIKILYSQ